MPDLRGGVSPLVPVLLAELPTQGLTRKASSCVQCHWRLRGFRQARPGCYSRRNKLNEITFGPDYTEAAEPARKVILG